ncbi:RecT family recombinase [Cytobacillus pseudoceanisediminis]|uniref:RecT family recombinase n=1 Tax=Cytobacillus pseudoceanisediminis TaxID=3051614 RepID=UPI003C2AC8FA
MTQKLITFSKEVQSLIWVTKLQPARANEAEANVFLKICEEYGLNPLLGDITFQKFETKWGPRVSYLISRDARLKHAMRQDDYENMLSGVVKEGDHFEVNVADGIPIHRFGSKRGKIVGAWAVVKTKTRGNTVVFPDFDEYHAALSPKNPVWNSMPSAMIEKVAQSQALSRTFPLGVAFASEDEIIIDLDSAEANDTPCENEKTVFMADELKKARDQKPEKKEEKSSKKKTAKTEKSAKDKTVTSPVSEQQPVVEESPADEQPPVKETVEVQEENKPVQSDSQQEEATPIQDSGAIVPDSQVLEFVQGILGQSGNGTTFLRVQYKQGDTQKEVFARGEDKISIFDEFVPGTKFTAKIEDVNGFSFVLSAQAV